MSAAAPGAPPQPVHTPFSSLQPTCGVPARRSGCVSLFVQTAILTVGIALVSVLFIHVGGYQTLFPRFVNVTETTVIVPMEVSISTTTVASTTTTTTATTTTTTGTTEPSPDDVVNALNDSTDEVIDEEIPALSFGSGEDDNNTTATHTSTVVTTPATTTTPFPTTTVSHALTSESNDGNTVSKFLRRRYLFHGPFEQIRDVILRFGKRKLSLLSILRCTCLAYLGLSLLWLLSLFVLIASLKYEIIDLVIVNAVILVVMAIFALVKSFLVGILIFYQYEFRWRTFLTICFSVGGLLLCFIFAVIAFWMLIKWMQYINYMNGYNCFCVSSIVRCVKSRRYNRRDAAAGGTATGAPADYSIPDATRNANLPYIDDAPVNNFSNF